MKIVVFGLTVSSSWGNGHATLWRGLCRALAGQGHHVTFFERDLPYYRTARDLDRLPGGRLALYAAWPDILAEAARECAAADVAIVTSFCPDGPAAIDLVAGQARSLRVFYDLDTPVTLAQLDRGETVAYLGAHDLSGFDLVLSYTGGPALRALRDRLGARRVAPLYGHADPDLYRPAPPSAAYRADLSYIGTFAADRQEALERLLIAAARARPERRFLIAGAQYPADFPWGDNIAFVRHLPPGEHPSFFASSRLTLNVTRRVMAGLGWCPSGRLFEAAACGAAMVSDDWEGLDRFFTPGREILVAEETADVLAALDRDDGELRRIGAAARERVLAEHTAAHRAAELVAAVEQARSRAATPQPAEA